MKLTRFECIQRPLVCLQSLTLFPFIPLPDLQDLQAQKTHGTQPSHTWVSHIGALLLKIRMIFVLFATTKYNTRYLAPHSNSQRCPCCTHLHLPGLRDNQGIWYTDVKKLGHFCKSQWKSFVCLNKEGLLVMIHTDILLHGVLCDVSVEK